MHKHSSLFRVRTIRTICFLLTHNVARLVALQAFFLGKKLKCGNALAYFVSGHDGEDHRLHRRQRRKVDRQLDGGRRHQVRLHLVKPSSNFLASFRTNKLECLQREWMRLHHSPDASTFPGFKLMCFVYIIYFQKEELNALAFNWDTCSHLALCLHVMPLHYNLS